MNRQRNVRCLILNFTEHRSAILEVFVRSETPTGERTQEFCRTGKAPKISIKEKFKTICVNVFVNFHVLHSKTSVPLLLNFRRLLIRH